MLLAHLSLTSNVDHDHTQAVTRQTSVRFANYRQAPKYSSSAMKRRPPAQPAHQGSRNVESKTGGWFGRPESTLWKSADVYNNAQQHGEVPARKLLD